MRIIDNDYHGGKKVICLRRCAEDDFKPLDCESYPYFPKFNQNGQIEFLKGNKCPLLKEELTEHRKTCLNIWQELLKDQKVRVWLKKVVLVGYETEE